MPPRKQIFQGILIGDTEVGKSQICNRFCNDKFSEEINPTFAGNFCCKTLDNDLIQLFDIAGDETFSSSSAAATPLNKEPHFVLIVCSFDREESLAKIKELYCKQVKIRAPDTLCMVVINKSDIPDSEKKFSHKDVDLLIKSEFLSAEEKGRGFNLDLVRETAAQVSAKTTPDQITDLFQEVIDAVKKQQTNKEKEKEKEKEEVKDEEEKKTELVFDAKLAPKIGDLQQKETKRNYYGFKSE